MKEKEKQLFKALCRFKDPFTDTSLTEYATSAVLGCLFMNRMQGVAFGVLRQNGLLSRVDREFRNALGAAYEQNVLKNESFRTCVGMLSDILAPCAGEVAMLKGAYLCAHYPDGYRTSNDIDLLVLPKNVTAVGRLLSAAGFRQGHVRDGRFVPADRQAIITSRMMRGETVPYIKEVDLPFMRFLEVDVNFSLDYKNGDEGALSDMLSRVRPKNERGLSVPTLDDADFFLHLCAHLYKEATTLPWIDMHRDMTLYKYSDLYLLLSEMDDARLQAIFERAEALGLEKICAYAVLGTMGLFEVRRPRAEKLARAALDGDPDLLRRVVSPHDKKTFLYQTDDVSARFFMGSRADDLKEERP